MVLYKYIVQLFVRFVAGDEKLLSDIVKFPGDFTLAEGEWHFTLPALHEFLRANEKEFSEIDYPTFRQQIFNNPINQSLYEQGGKILIVKNHNKVDKSIYTVRGNIKKSV